MAPQAWCTPQSILSMVSICIATLALVQPWIIWFWKSYVKRGAVNIFNTGQIEVGFSGYGPTVGLHGTMIASDRNQFVHKVTAQVTRKKDGASHALDWAFFRGYQVPTVQPQNFTLELASGYLLTTSQPHRYNMFFMDFPVKEEIDTVLRRLIETWEKYSEAHQAAPTGTEPPKPLEEEVPSALYREFCKSPESSGAFDEVRRLCYWEPGEYALRMVVQTALPACEFSRTWTFQLTNEDKDRLLLNVVSILMNACTGRSFDWNLAYTKYVDEQP